MYNNYERDEYFRIWMNVRIKHFRTVTLECIKSLWEEIDIQGNPMSSLNILGRVLLKAISLHYQEICINKHLLCIICKCNLFHENNKQ